MNKYRLENIFSILLVILSIISLIGCGAAGTTTTDTGNTTSPDTTTEQPQQSTPLLVAVGDDGIVASSTDGNTWIVPNPGTGQIIRDIAYGSWVAVGLNLKNGNSEIAHSDDYGTLINNPVHSVSGQIFLGVTTDGSGNWLAVGTGGSLAQSTDGGVTWADIKQDVTKADLSEVAYGKGQWVVVGDKDEKDSIIYYSQDRTNWHIAIINGNLSPLRGVATNGDGQWVAVGDKGSIFRSTDNGVNWNSTNSNTANDLQDVAFGNGRWVAVGQRGTIVYSDDGNTWTSVNNVPAAETLFGVVYANSIARWVAVGQKGMVIYSNNNGQNWSPAAAPPNNGKDLFSIAFKP